MSILAQFRGVWEAGREKNRARSCLLVTKRVQWGKGVKSRSQRETMQMWEGEIGGAEKCPHYAYGIHTELCRTVWDIGWQGILKWVLDATQRYKEKPVHQQETVVQPASERGWDLGIWEGSRWTGSDNMQEQIWSATTTEKNMRVYPF